MRSMLTAWAGRIKKALVQALLPAQIAEGADVGEREAHTEKIFIPHVGDGVTAIFDRHSAAIPVVSGLGGGELQLFDLVVEAEAAGYAQSAPVETSIA